jgi:hypothetical protein
MANWFETVTKTLADDKLSRRKAMRKAAGAAAGIALAAFIPGEAFAASDTCTPPGNCSIGFATCGHNINGNCNCYTKHGTGIRASQCGCNVFCSQIQTCTNSHGCPAGSFCAFFSGCDCTGTTGYCVPKCTHTCILGADHTGATSAHR